MFHTGHLTFPNSYQTCSCNKLFVHILSTAWRSSPVLLCGYFFIPQVSIKILSPQNCLLDCPPSVAHPTSIPHHSPCLGSLSIFHKGPGVLGHNDNISILAGKQPQTTCKWADMAVPKPHLWILTSEFHIISHVMKDSFWFFSSQAFKNIKTTLSSPTKKSGRGWDLAPHHSLPGSFLTHFLNLLSSSPYDHLKSFQSFTCLSSIFLHS